MSDGSERLASLASAERTSAARRSEIYCAHVAMADGIPEQLAREREVVDFELARRRRAVGASPATTTAQTTRPVLRVNGIAADLSPGAHGRQAALRGSRGSMLGALWNLSLRADVNSDRLGTFWWIGEPLLQVGMITFTVLFLHGADVFDMPSFPFAVIGVIIWLTFRTSFTAVLAGPAGLSYLLDHPAISRLDVTLVRSLKGMVVNSVVGLILMSVCIFFSVAQFPENILKVVASLLGALVLGLGTGLAAHHGALHYSGLRKVYPLLLRLLAMISGLFFVSEQAPGFIADYILWNPLLHLSQFARSGWFLTYETRDASLIYTLAAIGFVLLLGLACAVASRRTRSRLGEPA